MKQKIEPVKYIKGELNIPGDKSISHRSIIFTSLARGKSVVSGFLESEDCLNTINAFRNMGINIERNNSGQYIIGGKGLNGLSKPVEVIDCGNSGTTMRLLSGLLAAQNFYSVLTGDNSLCKRPMDRIIAPLSEMGARIWAEEEKYAPLGIKGSNLQGVTYRPPVASAQVKSAILLAGLFAKGETSVIEPSQSRDHTERMLKDFGVDIEIKKNIISFPGDQNISLEPQDIKVPADISSAAFFIVAALLLPDSELLLKNIGINPTRSGIIEVIKKMGGEIEFLNRSKVSGEPVADILVKSSELKGTIIKGKIIPRLIDEIPIIAVLAARAEGRTIIKDAAELRVKETDRIEALVSEFSKLGVEIKELPDGMIIEGSSAFKGGLNVDSHGDHRIAMSLAIAGLVAEEEIVITNSQVINISFPDFIERLKTLVKIK